jgi:hypothetical protein
MQPENWALIAQIFAEGILNYETKELRTLARLVLATDDDEGGGLELALQTFCETDDVVGH